MNLPPIYAGAVIVLDCLCVLLDELSPGWKADFLEREDSLFDIFKEKAGDFITDSHHLTEVSLETESVINFALENRRNEFKNFEDSAGFPLTIEGKIQSISFDPINIVFLGDTLLHKKFLKVKIGDEQILIQQPVMANFKDRIQNISRLRLILKDKPVENIESLTIDGVGEIKGRYIKEGESYNLFVN